MKTKLYNTEYLPYDLITNLQVGESYKDIINEYGLENTTKVCLKVLRSSDSPGNPLYFNGQSSKDLLKGLLYHIEKKSKKEFPELWI